MGKNKTATHDLQCKIIDDMCAKQYVKYKHKSTQGYIDEAPFWADNTELQGPPITGTQWRIWMLATAGQFFLGLLLFITGIALPLIRTEFSLNDAQVGTVGAAMLMGILIGASLLGGLSDKFGRKKMFIAEMAIFCVFIIAVTLSQNYYMLVISLFGLGMALGCDYPTSHLIISESISSRVRGKMVLGVFGFQAIGALTGSMIGYVVLFENPELEAWRWMYGIAIVPAILSVISRFSVPESPHWLMSQHRVDEAEASLAKILKRHPDYPKNIDLSKDSERLKKDTGKYGYKQLFEKKYRRATIFASVPWFLQDLGTYGIGLFTPTILATAFGATSEASSISNVIYNDMLAAKGAAFLDILLIFGMFAAVFLTDILGRVKLQVIGFIGCAAGLLVVALSSIFDQSMSLLLLFMGFMLFNFMTNMGPNSQTYLISGEVFPTKMRSKGAGFATSVSKAGAVFAAFMFPVLLGLLGTSGLLIALVGTSLLGALITWKFKIETKGVNLEELHSEEKVALQKA